MKLPPALKYYILIGQTPVAVSLMEWAKWFETAGRRVFGTTVGPYWISTVFLGIDHSFSLYEGPPVLFETMIFIKEAFETDKSGMSLEERGEFLKRLEDTALPELRYYQTRACTWLEAEMEHEIAVSLVEDKTGLKREDANGNI